MNTVNICRRKGKKGIWVRWYEHVPGKHQKQTRYKKCNSRHEAEMFRHLKYQQLNLDVYKEISVEWQQAKKEYLQRFQIEGKATATRDKAESILRRFEDYLVNLPVHLHSLNQGDLDGFLGQVEGSDYTRRKYATAMNTFLRWCRSRNYRVQDISCPSIKVSTKSIQVISLWTVYRLWIKADAEMRVYLLLLLCTGMRAKDVLSLKPCNFDARKSQVVSIEQKTGKQKVSPLPQNASDWLRIQKWDGFGINLRTAWERLCMAANLAERGTLWKGKRQVICKVNRQDFRVLHSTLIQAGSGLEIARQALQHGDKKTTDQHYTDRLYVLRRRVEEVFSPIVDRLLNHE